MSVRRNFRCLGLESLETRRVMAGNVSASLVGDDLVITGDANANDIRIHQVLGKLVVEGLNGTTVNGDDKDKFAVDGDVRVDLNGGLDKLTVDHGTPLLFNTDIKGDLQIDEVETVKLANLDLHGSLDVDLEGVNGRVDMFDYDIDGGVNIHGVGGAQKAFIANGFVDLNFNINFQNGGGDEVFIAGLTAKQDLNITTGSDADKVTVDILTRVLDDLFIDTNGGDDNITVQSVIITDDLNIDVGDGDNQVKVNSVLADDIFINLDDGDDDVLYLAVEEADIVTIDVDNDDALKINDDNIRTLNIIND
jgi:hypothetical protein